MSRREYKNQDYIEWLKSLGCVFCAPLSENDTSDNISGQPMIVNPNHSVTYDNNENSWYFEDLSASTYDRIAGWDNLSLPFDTTNVGYTMLYEVKINQDGYNQWSSAMGMVAPLVLGGRTALLNIADPITTQLDVWYKIAHVFPKYDGVSRYSYDYTNGFQVASYNRGTTRFTGSALTNIKVDVNYRNNTIYSNCKFYMRNAMIFNANLTLAQIKEIQKIQ